MRTFLIALMMTLATQAGANEAVYEFRNPETILYLACDGDTDDEKDLLILMKKNNKWKVRFDDNDGTVQDFPEMDGYVFEELAGPELIWDGLKYDKPLIVKFDLRNYYNPKFSFLVMGSKIEIDCSNITERIEFYLDTAMIETPKFQEYIQEYNSKIDYLEAQLEQQKVKIDKLELQDIVSQSLISVDEVQAVPRLDFLCNYFKQMYPEDHKIMTRKKIATASGLKNICK